MKLRARPEPSVPFDLPDDEPIDEQAIKAATLEGQYQGFKTAMLLFSATPRSDRDLQLTAAAVRQLCFPDAESVTATAARLRVSRKTIYARMKQVRAQFPFLSERGNTALRR